MRLARYGYLMFIMAAEAMLFFGCARKPINLENLPLPSPQELILKINQNKNELRDFSGAGSLEMSGSDLRRTVLGLRLEYLAPDYLSLNLKGPLGVHAGSLLLAGEYYNLKIGSDHVNKSGRIVDFEYPQGLNLLVGPSNLHDLFEPLIMTDVVPESARIAKDLTARQIQLVWSQGNQSHKLGADPYKPLFLQELITTLEGDTVWYKQVSGVKKRGPVFLPNSWNVLIGQGETFYQIKMRLPQIEVNTGLSPDDFPIIPDTKEVQGG